MSGLLTHTFTQPSTAPRNGSPVAVSAMTPAQLSTYLDADVTLGTAGANATSQNGLRQRLADGRVSDWQDYEDQGYIINTLRAAP